MVGPKEPARERASRPRAVSRCLDDDDDGDDGDRARKHNTAVVDDDGDDNDDDDDGLDKGDFDNLSV